MEYREKKFKGAGENGKKSWKKENAGRNGNNGRNVNGKTERNSGRKETSLFKKIWRGCDKVYFGRSCPYRDDKSYVHRLLGISTGHK